jgi:hypothetical protein
MRQSRLHGPLESRRQRLASIRASFGRRFPVLKCRFLTRLCPPAAICLPSVRAALLSTSAAVSSDSLSSVADQRRRRHGAENSARLPL